MQADLFFKTSSENAPFLFSSETKNYSRQKAHN